LYTEVIELNRLAMDQMINKKELVIIPGATHLFEEPGTIEQAERSLLTGSCVTCTRPPYSPLGCLIILKSA